MSYSAFGAPPLVTSAIIQQQQPPQSTTPGWVPWAIAGGVAVVVVGAIALTVTANYEAGKAFAPDKEHEKTFAVAGAALGTQYGLPGLALLGVVGVIMHGQTAPQQETLSGILGP